MIPLRIFRSFRANYYGDDVLNAPAAYPQEYFAELSANGFNAVWIRGVLRELAVSDEFPELSDPAGVEAHQQALRCVVARAEKHGVKVLLYLNEPLGLPADHDFWRRHPEVRGAAGDSIMDGWARTNAFCTSVPSVRRFLRQSAERLFAAVPGLGGWFAITASEHHTHCWSHRGWKTKDGEPAPCPRCVGRPPGEVAAGVVELLRDGTRAAAPDAHCIAWNWSWTMYEEDPQPGILARLPKDAGLLLDWERGGWREGPDGRRVFIDEYSLGYVGPSERFAATAAEARKHGLKLLAKLQVGTTHELATVPNLPVIDNLYCKLCGLEREGVTGLLATWNFGNAFSLNTAAVGKFFATDNRPEPRQFVAELAAEHFPGCDAAGVAAAVERFSAALAWYPFDMMLLYHGPMNYALAYPLLLQPLSGQPGGNSWLDEPRGDDFAPSLTGPWSLDEVIDAFDRLAEDWSAAADAYAAALAGSDSPNAARELGVARTVGACFRSTVNVYRTYRLRLALAPGQAPSAEARGQFAAIAADEIANLEAVLPALEADSRLGFHAECQAQFFDASRVREKLEALRAAAL